MNDNVNEIKAMLDKLNKELESLRAENQELKQRLAKYEEPKNYDNNVEIDLDTLYYKLRSKNPENTNIKRVCNALKRVGYKTLEDCKELTLTELFHLSNVGTTAFATCIVIFEHYGMCFELYDLPKRFLNAIDECRQSFRF